MRNKNIKENKKALAEIIYESKNLIYIHTCKHLAIIQYSRMNQILGGSDH